MNKATKQITDILSACGCAPAVTTDNNGNDTIKINAPIFRAPAVIGYTIKSTSNEGIYFLVNGWQKHVAFWIPEFDLRNHLEKVIFKTKGSAKASLTKLLKIMPDYSSDIFTLCEIYSNGGLKCL